MKRHVYAWLFVIFALAIALMAEALIERGDVMAPMVWPVRIFAGLTCGLCFVRFYTVLSK